MGEEYNIEIQLNPVHPLPDLLLSLWKELPQHLRIRPERNNNKNTLRAEDVLVEVYEYLTAIKSKLRRIEQSLSSVPPAAPAVATTARVTLPAPTAALRGPPPGLVRVQTEQEKIHPIPADLSLKNGQQFVHNKFQTPIKVLVPRGGRLIRLPNGQKHIFVPQVPTNIGKPTLISVPPLTKYSISHSVPGALTAKDNNKPNLTAKERHQRILEDAARRHNAPIKITSVRTDSAPSWKPTNHGLYCKDAACQCPLSRIEVPLDPEYVSAVCDHLMVATRKDYFESFPSGTKRGVLDSLLRGLRRREMHRFIGLFSSKNRASATCCIPLHFTVDTSSSLIFSSPSGPTINIASFRTPLLHVLFRLFRKDIEANLKNDLVLTSRMECATSSKIDKAFCVNPWHFERTSPALMAMASIGPMADHACNWRLRVTQKENGVLVCSLCQKVRDGDGEGLTVKVELEDVVEDSNGKTESSDEKKDNNGKTDEKKLEEAEDEAPDSVEADLDSMLESVEEEITTEQNEAELLSSVTVDIKTEENVELKIKEEPDDEDKPARVERRATRARKPSASKSPPPALSNEKTRRSSRVRVETKKIAESKDQEDLVFPEVKVEPEPEPEEEKEEEWNSKAKPAHARKRDIGGSEEQGASSPVKKRRSGRPKKQT